jgi:predicted nucleotidyltransferase
MCDRITLDMLKARILQTIRFFNLQDLPVTLLELETYLLADMDGIRPFLDNQWDLKSELAVGGKVLIQDILKCIEGECQEQIVCSRGFYFLRGRGELVEKRLRNYTSGIVREKLIRRYAGFLKFIPFVRGAALAGSQALGQQKFDSDIDLLIITDPEFMWLARTLVTGYFQLIGKRRYGKKIVNRFCLNHYIAAPKEVGDYKNLYTAAEYLKLRPLVYADTVHRFQNNNKGWILGLFPNAEFEKGDMTHLRLQKILEKIFTNKFGYWLENKLKNWQLPKIRTEEKFIVVRDDELSFHPQSKQQGLLEKFFKGE